MLDFLIIFFFPGRKKSKFQSEQIIAWLKKGFNNRFIGSGHHLIGFNNNFRGFIHRFIGFINNFRAFIHHFRGFIHCFIGSASPQSQLFERFCCFFDVNFYL